MCPVCGQYRRDCYVDRDRTQSSVEWTGRKVTKLSPSEFLFKSFQKWLEFRVIPIHNSYRRLLVVLPFSFNSFQSTNRSRPYKMPNTPNNTSKSEIQSLYRVLPPLGLGQRIENHTGCPKKHENANSALNLKPFKITMQSTMHCHTK